MIVNPRFAAAALLVVLQCSGVCADATIDVGDASYLQEVECPNDCADLFKRLDVDGVQETKFRIRGEPKSGTGTSEEWAWAALSSTCVYLNTLYGDESCHTVAYGPKLNRRHQFHDMVFEPRLESPRGPETCPCANVQRVNVSMTILDKHTLPVDKGCSFRHPHDIVTDDTVVCTPRDGHQLESQDDLWECVEQAGCVIQDDDDRLQLVVLRDPREVTVSTYYHQLRRVIGHHQQSNTLGSVDEYFQKYLRVTCMWVSLRYFLFSEILRDRSGLFWYDDHEADPVDWHGRYLNFIGVNLPHHMVVDLAMFSSGGDINSALDFKAKGIDSHPGGNKSSKALSDDLGPESLSMMNDVMRKWVPPVILKRFGIPFN